MKKNKLFWILTVVCVLNFAAHLYFYPSLPDIVPTHWGFYISLWNESGCRRSRF